MIQLGWCWAADKMNWHKPGTRAYRRAIITAGCLLLSAAAHQAAARPSKTALIDGLCQSIRNEFVETKPLYFAGPDPWQELDAQPNSIDDKALVSIYREGSSIRWLVLEMLASDNSWFETTQYYFDEVGVVRMRERDLHGYAANIHIQERVYLQNRRVIKTLYQRNRIDVSHALSGGKEDPDSFLDPNAPLYTDAGQLPVEFLGVDPNWAYLRNIYPLEALSSLVKFSRPASEPIRTVYRQEMQDFDFHFRTGAAWPHS